MEILLFPLKRYRAGDELEGRSQVLVQPIAENEILDDHMIERLQ